MSKTYIPAHYHTPLNVYEMQRAIEFIKSNFQAISLTLKQSFLIPFTHICLTLHSYSCIII